MDEKKNQRDQDQRDCKELDRGALFDPWEREFNSDYQKRGHDFDDPSFPDANLRL